MTSVFFVRHRDLAPDILHLVSLNIRFLPSSDLFFLHVNFVHVSDVSIIPVTKRDVPK